ncbi:MAG: RimK family protein [Pyrinomonadaceae bacterium]|nr:RimK family protein [Phycisphaerales bacterium]
MPILIVLENPKSWPLKVPRGVEVVPAKTYLLDKLYSQMRSAKVFNFCRSYSYQTVGYYVSLLAAARGHKPLPSITTFQDLKLSPVVRIASADMEELLQESLKRIKSKTFVLTVYFGHNIAPRYDRLSKALFNAFPAPFLSATFRHDGQWELESIRPIATSEIPAAHKDFVLDKAKDYFTKPFRVARPRTAYRFDLAILNDPNATEKPSTEKAIRKFIKAAKSVGLDPEIIGKDDYGRLAEFDALFIRETTYVNHHTFRFSRRAAAEGLVVIDDPDSILKCTNKVYMQELFDRHGINSPKTMVVHEDNAEQIISNIGLPCVIKRPDSSFSKGVIKVEKAEDLIPKVMSFLEDSELALAQEWVPSGYDWRVGVLDRKPIFVCKYHMAKGHWQIVSVDSKGERDFGRVEAMYIEDAPPPVTALALRAANLVGDGFYGVDVKEVNGRFMVMEVNDNPSVDCGYEDAVYKDEVYLAVMRTFVERLEAKRR